MKKILISSLIAGATSLAFAVDNYHIGGAWGGSGMANNCSEGYGTFTQDTAIFDYQYYLENKGTTGSSVWEIAYYLYDRADLIPFLSPTNVVVKNLYYNNGEADVPVKITFNSAASGTSLLRVSNDFTFEMGEYNSSVVFANADSGKRFDISVGGNFNVGTANQANGVKGTITMGSQAILMKNFSAGAIDVRNGGTFKIYSDKITSGKLTLDNGSIMTIGSSATASYTKNLTLNGISATGTSYLDVYANNIVINDAITIDNSETGRRITFYGDTLSTKSITASNKGWVYFYARVGDTRSFIVDGDITLSDEGKLMSQEGYSFGSATKRANITLSDKSALSFGFTYSNTEALKRNVYAGVLTLNGTADARPIVYLTNITNVQGRVATWDVKGIQGTDGMISTFTLSSGNQANLILGINAGETYSYSGALSNINILMTGTDNKGTQYLRGDNVNIKIISVRGGKLYINGENLVNTNISFENAVGSLGIVSKDTDFGVLNVNKLNLNHRSILLLDISDAQQDIITAKNVSFADPTLNNNKTLHIDFTLGDDIILGKQYKIFEATEALQDNGALEYITSTNNKDYFANFVISGNALNVFFTNVAVPEPAEWAMIFGALALGLAIYRRRK